MRCCPERYLTATRWDISYCPDRCPPKYRSDSHCHPVGCGRSRYLRPPAIPTDIGMSRRTFERMYRRATGETLRDYVRRVRVDRAIVVLLKTDWKIESVADELGWKSKKNLYRAIK